MERCWLKPVSNATQRRVPISTSKAAVSEKSLEFARSMYLWRRARARLHKYIDLANSRLFSDTAALDVDMGTLLCVALETGLSQQRSIGSTLGQNATYLIDNSGAQVWALWGDTSHPPSLRVNKMGGVYPHFIHLYKMTMGRHEVI